jgi:hypothetical protein
MPLDCSNSGSSLFLELAANADAIWMLTDRFSSFFSGLRRGERSDARHVQELQNRDSAVGAQGALHLSASFCPACELLPRPSCLSPRMPCRSANVIATTRSNRVLDLHTLTGCLGANGSRRHRGGVSGRDSFRRESPDISLPLSCS